MVGMLLDAFKKLTKFWKNIDSSNRRKLIFILVLVIVVAIAFLFLVNRKEYVVLYSNLDSEDAGEIFAKLEEMKVEALPEGSGTIKVLKAKEASVRMRLASEGYPKSGMNYDLFINNSAKFGATDFEKQKYLQFQLQERLQKAIMTMEDVENAIVTLSIPEQTSFVLKDDRQTPTASVLLKLQGDTLLTPKQIKGVEELVAKSISDLKGENISIIDSNMNVLNAFMSNAENTASNQLNLENQVREQLQKQILGLLEPAFGRKNVVAAVNVKLNFDKQTTETIKFEPVVDKEGIAVSINELIEKVQSTSDGNVAGVDANTGEIGNPVSKSTPDVQEKINRTVNYEVNQIKEQIEKAQGQVKELSVSVIIGKADINDDVKNRIRNIIATAVGIDSNAVAVQEMTFIEDNSLKEQIDRAQENLKKEKQFTLINNLLVNGGIALFVLILLIMAYRILTKSLATKEVIEGKNNLRPSNEIFQQRFAKEEIDEDLMGTEKATIKTKIDKMVKQHPEIVVQQVRKWLNE